MDLLRFKKMVPKRREMLAEGSAKPLPVSYRVNETAKILHPGFQKAKLVQIVQNTADTKTYVFESERPFYFRAGQYLTLGCKVGDSYASRPYAISSAPKAALQKKSASPSKSADFSADTFSTARKRATSSRWATLPASSATSPSRTANRFSPLRAAAASRPSTAWRSPLRTARPISP